MTNLEQEQPGHNGLPRRKFLWGCLVFTAATTTLGIGGLASLLSQKEGYFKLPSLSSRPSTSTSVMLSDWRLRQSPAQSQKLATDVIHQALSDLHWYFDTDYWQELNIRIPDLAELKNQTVLILPEDKAQYRKLQQELIAKTDSPLVKNIVTVADPLVTPDRQYSFINLGNIIWDPKTKRMLSNPMQRLYCATIDQILHTIAPLSLETIKSPPPATFKEHRFHKGLETLIATRNPDQTIYYRSAEADIEEAIIALMTSDIAKAVGINYLPHRTVDLNGFQRLVDRYYNGNYHLIFASQHQSRYQADFEIFKNP